MGEQKRIEKRTVVVLVAFAVILVLSVVIGSITFGLSKLITPTASQNPSDDTDADEPWATVLQSWDGDEADDADTPMSDYEKGQFFVLSDIHLDLAYTPAEGGERFCRDESKHGPSEDCYTSRFDYDDDANYDYGQYGCDAPLSLLASCLSGMRQVNSSPDFLLIGGDLAMHCSPSLDATLEAVRNATNTINEFFLDTVVIPTIGNNDVFPEDQLPYGPSQLLSDLAVLWEPWFGTTEAYESFKNGGYFSVTPLPGLRVISLNTLYYTEDWCPRNDTACTPEEIDQLVREDDPNGQFAWLEEELSAAKALGEDVILTGHMSPGRTRGFDKNWRGQYQEPFLDIVERYHEHIAGAIFGHIHRDAFMMLEVKERGTPVNLNTFLVNSALSPREKQNPSFRQVTYRHASAHSRQEHGATSYVSLETFQVYYLNLSAVFESDSGAVPVWVEEYDFAESYGASERGLLNSLLPADVQRVVHDIFESDQCYDEYLAHWASLSDSVTIKHSKAEYLCSLIAIDNSAFNDCVDLLAPTVNSEPYDNASSIAYFSDSDEVS